MKRLQLNKKSKDKLFYATYIEENGKEIMVVGKDKDMVSYRAYQTAYNPEFEDTGKVVRVNEDELYANSRHHTKDIIIVDGDEESYAGFLLTTKSKKKARHSNAILDHEKTLISKENKPQYMERKMTIKERDKDKLLKVDRNQQKRKVLNPNLSSQQVDTIKMISTSEANRKQSKEYRKKKIKK